MEKDLNCRYFNEQGMDYGLQCNLRKANEESIDQVMIHSEKMSAFGCFTLQSLNWVVPASLRYILIV